MSSTSSGCRSFFDVGVVVGETTTCGGATEALASVGGGGGVSVTSFTVAVSEAKRASSSRSARAYQRRIGSLDAANDDDVAEKEDDVSDEAKSDGTTAVFAVAADAPRPREDRPLCSSRTALRMRRAEGMRSVSRINRSPNSRKPVTCAKARVLRGSSWSSTKRCVTRASSTDPSSVRGRPVSARWSSTVARPSLLSARHHVDRSGCAAYARWRTHGRTAFGASIASTETATRKGSTSTRSSSAVRPRGTNTSTQYVASVSSGAVRSLGGGTPPLDVGVHSAAYQSWRSWSPASLSLSASSANRLGQRTPAWALRSLNAMIDAAGNVAHAASTSGSRAPQNLRRSATAALVFAEPPTLSASPPSSVRVSATAASSTPSGAQTATMTSASDWSHA
mmetsp:Transcript_16219/g.65531  ORF Transcript_16219/g.65531 Transcript_16219/m.65531 type:complete len:394 (+) Transcript_16219:807-1988(+)